MTVVWINHTVQFWQYGIEKSLLHVKETKLLEAPEAKSDIHINAGKRDVQKPV